MLPILFLRKGLRGGYTLDQNGLLGKGDFHGQHRVDRQGAPVRFIVYSQDRLVIVTFAKKVTAADIANYAARLREHPSFRPEFSEIADLSAVEELDLQADEFLRLADAVDPFAYEARRAFVVQNSVQAHAARLHRALRTHRNFEIFHSFADARRWISE